MRYMSVSPPLRRWNARRWQQCLLLCGAVACFVAASTWSADRIEAADLTDDQVKFFENKIRPVLVKECYSCHSNQTGNARGGLRLDTRQLTELGGDSGSAVVPGDVDASTLISAIRYDDFAMPPERQLPQAVIDDFVIWVEMGAPDPRETETTEFTSSITDAQIDEAKDTFWAYQTPKRISPPSVSDSNWPQTDIDQFVLAKLDDAGLHPSGDADEYQILRRLCVDLIGLPPTPEQIVYFDQAWQRDPGKAVEMVVDKLLQSPQFGERWGRHWLDVVRFAESNGKEVNMTFPNAWRYRDYVIDSFNEDKPYDRFLQEQIAGDLLPADSDQQWADNLVATGFLAIGPKNLTEQRNAQFAADLADEQLDVTTRVILGMSVACARCHDHKFDPIPQTDYYALAGVFANTETYFGVPASKFGSPTSLQNRRPSNLIRMPVDDLTGFETGLDPEEVKRLEQELIDTRRQATEARRAQRSGEKKSGSVASFARLATKAEAISVRLGGVDGDGKPIAFCMGAQSVDSPRDVRLLVRGEIDQPGQVVPRGFPKVLSGGSESIDPNSSGRLELARWISDKQNPLTARVMVNRIWLHLLGSGIVTTPENYGSTGKAPTHPELLDHLAIEFMENDWSIKSVVRSIVTSRIYRTDSKFRRDAFELDPDNHLLWRVSPRRLDAEVMRDAMLQAAGVLDKERPVASEVAKAGYMRVRDGNLVNPAAFIAGGSGMTDRQGMASGMRRRMDQSRPAGGQDVRDQIRKRMQELSPQQRREFGRMSPEDRRQATMKMFEQSAAKIMSKGDLLDMTDAKIRSVYLPIVRNEVPRSLEVFDFAESSMIVGQRESSNTPNQSLYMMNNAFVLQQSEALARRVLSERSDQRERIDLLFKLAYGRSPHQSEQLAIAKFASDFARTLDYRERATVTWTAVAQSLLASAEFRYLD